MSTEHKQQQINFNTILLFLVTVMLPVIGFFCKHELEKIEMQQERMWTTFVPKTEVQIEITDLANRVNQQNVAIESLRAKVDTLELNITAAVLRKP